MKADGFQARIEKRIQELKDNAFASIQPGKSHEWANIQGKVIGLQDALAIFKETLRQQDTDDE
jgi:hypothetical protein